jgi:hypothetical protein
MKTTPLKRLIRVGSAAAALGSIVGLVFTIGGQAKSVFWHGSSHGVRLERVKLERMPFRTYLHTKEHRTQVTGLGYSRKDLDADGLAVDYDARFTGWTKGAAFPVELVLQAKDASGRVRVVMNQPTTEALDAPSDACGCSGFFFLPHDNRAYRVSVQIFRPNARNAEPLETMESAWFRRSPG